MSTASRRQPTAIARWRINVLLVIVLGLTLALGQQLIQIQVGRELRGRDLRQMAQQELRGHEVLQPRRGTIRDRNGVALALNVNRPSLYVDPGEVEEPDKLAILLAPMIGRSPMDLLSILSDSEREWDRLARWLPEDVADQITKLDDGKLPKGFYLVDEAQRAYPQGEFASRIVGVANHEGVGITGVEAFYDGEIKGVTGTLEAERSAAQQPIMIAPQQVVEPQNGMDVTLTIDSFVQKTVEDELRMVVEEQQAEGASILVMDPNSGEVLGMASWPPFDPNRYTDYPLEQINHNSAITDVYEPGSTMKVLVTTIGLQTGAFTTETTVNDTGMVSRYGEEMGNFDRSGHGPITPAKVLYYSSNIGALLLAELIGTDKFYKHLKLLGYGQQSGIDLGGEAEGIVNWPNDDPENWSDLTLDQNAFGQGIATTPLQHLNAISAVANGGLLMWPHVVKEKCINAQCTPIKSRVVRRVFDKPATDKVREMLIRSSENYGAFYWSTQGHAAFEQPLVPGYKVAAKTGTSQIAVNGGYDHNSVIGSVVGWAPAENPRISVLVKIDRPKHAEWGIEAAIPVYQRVVAKLMPHLRVPPDPSYVGEGQTIGGQ